MPREVTLDDIRTELAERSLADFTRLGWKWIDKADFVGNWHIDAISDHLEAVNRGHIKRLIINIPPRHMKSTGTCVAWPAWTWLQDPAHIDTSTELMGPGVQFLYSSYSGALTARDSRKCRKLINSPWYRERWRDRFKLASDQNAKTRFDNDHMGYRIATSVDAMTTGEGGDILVIDDPHNVRQAESDTVRAGVLTWYDETMSNRHNDPVRGATVVIMQRVKEDDLTGHLLAQQHEDWVHLCLPARFEPDHPSRWRGTPGVQHTNPQLIDGAGDPRVEDGELLWPKRMPRKQLDKLEATMGSYAVAGQMQQRPAPREGGMFKRAWFEREGGIVQRHEVPPGTRWVRHWDLAATKLKVTDSRGARTAGVKLGKAPDGRYFVVDMIAKGVEGAAVKKLIKDTAKADGMETLVSLPQDPGQAGKTQKQDFYALLDGYNIKVKGEVGDKVQRAQPFADQCEGGMVYLVFGDWNKEFLDELCLFPGGKRKDIADACSGAYTQLTTNKAEADDNAPVGPRVYTREEEMADEY